MGVSLWLASNSHKQSRTALKASFNKTTTGKHKGLTFHQYLDELFPFFPCDNWDDHLVAEQETDIIGNPILKAKQKISFSLINYDEDTVDVNWELIWQNKDLLVVFKPALLPVQKTTRNIYFTLTELIRRQEQLPSAQALHRLDLDTSGLMIFAKSSSAAKTWQPRLKELLTRKIYRAVILGKPDWQELSFESRIGKKSDSDIRCKMYVVNEDEKGQESNTHFKVLSSKNDYSIVECELFTGRKHQIRAHLAYLGHPIVGDKIYSNNGHYYLNRLNNKLTEEDKTKLLAKHHLLTAHEIELSFGDEIEPVSIVLNETKYPQEWKRFLEEIQLN